MKLRQQLRRWHVWLGWIVGVPLLFWTISGLVMVVKPIDEVRGTGLIREAVPVGSTVGIRTPIVAGRSVASMQLESRASGPRWIVKFADGGSRLADPATGTLLPAYGAADASREVVARYTGTAHIVGTSRVAADSPPLELRRAMNGWRVVLDDGSHFYVDAGSGEIVARRTRWWRFYDLMWGLHIMDLQTREDTNNPWIIVFAILSLSMVLLAMVLLPLTSRRRKKRVSSPS